MFWIVIFSSLCALILCEDDQWRLVHTAQGPVRGYKDPDEGIYSFYGIPYAKAPTGRDKFKAPLPAPVWSETFEAVNEHVVCPQSDSLNMLPSSSIMKEDCLIANVYVPETNKRKLPVFILVHGGAYITGWGNMFTPKNLVKSKKLIAVTFNYRLGPLGFLCLGTKDIPGNAGMKDQVALVRWVKENIASFGGNPDDMILSGFSSGASAAETLNLSKMTKGFFKKIIPDSAGILAPYSIQLDPIENAKEYARLIKFDKVDSIYALENFYKNVPLQILISGHGMARRESVTIMAPCIERDIGEERFLDDSPINMLKSGNFEKLPMLYGFTVTDGMFRLPQLYEWKDQMNAKFSDFLPADLQFKNKIEKEKVAEQIKHFYFGDKLVGEDTVLAYIDYFTDVLFSYPILRSIKYRVEAGQSQIYSYQYSYVEDSAPVILNTGKRAPNHCAQTFAVLDGFWNGTRVVEKDVSEDIKQRKIYMTEIWLNFMLTGKPIPEGSDLPAWPPVSSNFSPHMAINRTLELQEFLTNDRFLFWEKIYDKHYRYPKPPMLPTKYRYLNADKLN